MASIFFPRETSATERRVAATPDTVKKLIAKGQKVAVEAGAGTGAHISDDDYKAMGAEIQPERATGLGNADIIVQINVPDAAQIGQMKEGSSLISFLWAFENMELVKALNAR